MGKISNLTAATSLNLSDLFAIVQGGVTKKATNQLLQDQIETESDLVRGEFAVADAVLQGLIDDLEASTSKVLYIDDISSLNDASSTWESLMSYNQAIGVSGVKDEDHVRIKGMIVSRAAQGSTVHCRLRVLFDSVELGSLQVSTLGEQDKVMFEVDVHIKSNDGTILLKGMQFYSSSNACDTFIDYDLNATMDMTDADNELEVTLDGYAPNEEVEAVLLSVELIAS